MTRSLQEAVFEYRAARGLIAAAMTTRGRMALGSGNLYRALGDLCWVTRVSNVGPFGRIAERVVNETIATLRREPRNVVLDSYRADPASAACASLYALTGKGPHDLWRDLIVLKRATAEEKGVILLKYVRTFNAVASMFDLPRLMKRYTFVLEPCWAGYCDPSLLMYIAPGNPVLVQCFTEEDYRFVAETGGPLVPIRLGPADWVDADLFKPAAEKKSYDLVMVANWAPHKRHAQLFRALHEIRDRQVRVLLIGFAWANRTAADVRREAERFGPPGMHLDIIENLPPTEVAAHVSQSKVFVFLSRKEGDNKALVEAMFAGVPAIVYDKTIGGARSRINASTGVLASDAELPAKIVDMIDHYDRFTPREWVLEHTGSANATRILNDALARAVTSAGGRYTEGIVEKTNSPNLAYKDPSCRARFRADYEFILGCRSDVPRSGALARDGERAVVKRDAVA
ncbi:MAG TPA: glycosyltransferase [Vicinamibacterales bacterium]